MFDKAHDDLPPSYDVIAPSGPSVTSQVPLYTPSSALVKGVPPGFQCLLQINQLFMNEKFTSSQGWGRSFEVLDPMGQRLYQANQHVQCCGPLYDLKVNDSAGHDVMQVQESCGCRCSREMEVIVPSFGVIGSVKLHLNAYVTHVSIMSPSKEVVLLILGPSFQTSIFGNVTFEVKSRDEEHVVGIIKSDASKYTMTFPMDLEVSMKAMILASCFYLDNLIYAKRRDVATRPSSD